MDANTAVETIVRQGLGKVRHFDLSYLWLQLCEEHNQESAVGKQHGRSRDEGTREGHKWSTHEEVRMRPIRPVESVDSLEGGCKRTPQYVCATCSTRLSAIVTNPVRFHSTVLHVGAVALVHSQVHQEQIVCALFSRYKCVDGDVGSTRHCWRLRDEDL